MRGGLDASWDTVDQLYDRKQEHAATTRPPDIHQTSQCAPVSTPYSSMPAQHR